MRRARVILDAAMGFLLILQMPYLRIGEAYHEWAGIGLVILFITHNVMNRKWYGILFKGRYTGLRILSTAINLLSVLSVILIAVSGIAMSIYAVPFSVIPIGMGKARMMHMAAVYWGFALISMHAGLHMRAFLKRVMSRSLYMIAAGVLFLCGVLAFFRERIPSYLFLLEHFVFFDFSTPLPLVIIEYMLMMYSFLMIGALLSFYIQKKGMSSR